METIIIFIVILLILVLSHEAGHFFTARAFGVKVEEFGFGLPPRIFGIRGKKTLYSLNFLPVGGFVKILGEEGEESENPESFGATTKWVRALILSAGVLANLALAYLIFSFISAAGFPQTVPGDEVSGNNYIATVDVAKNSPAASAGILPGDKITKLVSSEEELVPLRISDAQDFISKNRGGNIQIFIESRGEFLKKTLMPRISPPEGEGPLGIALSLVETRRAIWYQVPWKGVQITWNVAYSTVYGFFEAVKSIIIGGKEKMEITGPVGIFNLISSIQQSGWRNLLMFCGILSVNLAFINFLPIPGLDGGRVFFLIIEAARGKRISPRMASAWHGAGLALLLALMLLITYRDIVNLF